MVVTSSTWFLLALLCLPDLLLLSLLSDILDSLLPPGSFFTFSLPDFIVAPVVG